MLTPADSKSAEYFLLMPFTLSRSPRLTHLSSVAYVTPILSARCCRSCFVAPAITRSFTVLMPESLSNPPHLGPIPLIVSMSRSISTGLFLIVIDGGSLFMRVSTSMGSGRGVEKSGGTGIVRRGSFLVRRAKPYVVAAISIQKNPFVIPFKRVATEIPPMDSVVCEIFRNSYSICAGGKLGSTKVIPIRSRKAKANTALANMFKEYVHVAFLYVYEAGVLI